MAQEPPWSLAELVIRVDWRSVIGRDGNGGRPAGLKAHNSKLKETKGELGVIGRIDRRRVGNPMRLVKGRINRGRYSGLPISTLAQKNSLRRCHAVPSTIAIVVSE